MDKSTVKEIKERFDNDVERFSNLDTGQVTTIDAKISLEILTEAAKRITPKAKNLLDVGCGAGNYTLKMLSKIPNLNCMLVDLSQPMLDRAFQRVSSQTNQTVEILQGDIREVTLKENHYDIILAGAVLHHLRDDNDWEKTFKKLYKLLTPGGCLMISDLLTQETAAINDYTRERYGNYLESVKGIEYRKKVFEYIDKEDSPRPMTYQLELMKKVGFTKTFGGIK